MLKRLVDRAWHRSQRVRSVSKSTALRLTKFATVAAFTGVMTGCGGFQSASNSYKYNSSWNNFVMKHRNEGWATKAWHRRKHAFCNEACLDEFCDGFRAGYMSVADGGDGCTPAFPPRDYWGWQYQTGDGQKKVASWFSGYPQGCRAAEEDGIGNWSQIQTSYQIQKEYDQAGMLGENQHPGMYPMPEAIPAGQAASQKPLGQPSILPANAPESLLKPAEDIAPAVVPNTEAPPLRLDQSSSLPFGPGFKR